jgi:very-short-patch-repair endonuclease
MKPASSWQPISTGVPGETTRRHFRLDGAQHLENAEAYRRDRRKDQLLQEAGYFVLRFLAEDVGKHLDMVMDTIQRTLFSRQSRNCG